MNNKPNPKISFIIVNWRGGDYVELLLQSLSKTMPDDIEYEIIIVNNRRYGYGIRKLSDLPPIIMNVAKGYLYTLLKGYQMSKYDFEIPKQLKRQTNVYKTSIHPVIKNYYTTNLLGGAVSFSHVAGLIAGYAKSSKKSDYVFLLDHDTVFLKKNWIYEFIEIFNKNSKCQLIGVIKNDNNPIFTRPFLHPACLMFKRRFYENSKPEDIFQTTATGDTCSNITYLCEDAGNDYYVYKNTRNNLDVATIDGWGEIALDCDNDIFFVHHHHSSDKVQWIATMKKELRKI